MFIRADFASKPNVKIQLRAIIFRNLIYIHINKEAKFVFNIYFSIKSESFIIILSFKSNCVCSVKKLKQYPYPY